VKLLFAPFGTKEDMLAGLRRFRDEIATRQEELAAIFEAYLRDEDQFPERVHVNTVIYRLLWDYTQTELAWARWASEQVQGWRTVEAPGNREESLDVLRQALAES
jgi:Virulence activator alpha C-term